MDGGATKTLSVNVPESLRANFGQTIVKASHNLHTFSSFDDATLTEILAAYPRNRMRVYATRSEPVNFGAWQNIDTTGVSGDAIFECLKRGKLWINLQRIDLVDRNYSDMTARLYAQLSAQCPGFKPTYIHSYLLISSPNTVVYLHLDAYENMFWLTRGGKEFHLFPPADPRMVSQEMLESICVGADDFFQYRPEFESFGKSINVRPGEVMTWPQHSPHWIRNNGDINVGLGTFHGTPLGETRVLNYTAHEFFREHLPWFAGNDVSHDAWQTKARAAAYRACRRIFKEPTRRKTEFWATQRLNPDLPNGLETISGAPILTEYSRLNR